MCLQSHPALLTLVQILPRPRHSRGDYPSFRVSDCHYRPLVNTPVKTALIILLYSITMATVGSIKSFLTLQLLDGILDDGNCGSTGNLALELTRGIEQCALIGHSIINALSVGGINRLSGMSMVLYLALGIVSFAPLLGKISVVVLYGVMQSYSGHGERQFGKSCTCCDNCQCPRICIEIVDDCLYLSCTNKVDDNSWVFHPMVKSYNINGPQFFGSLQAFS
ncbi:LOW QUALITY PROTEIN: hypothetical protein ACHAXA_000526 [Cyclostephanos tholiformis]|uniref:Uncharacterized protein n=1 Tax=Cyclostephanos tholiformis TaxID=382380 RepID=A0ABD3STU9_9STRA